MSALAPVSCPLVLAVVECVDQQLLARPLPTLGAPLVDGGDRVAQQRLLVGVERAHEAFGVVRFADQQRVQREQELDLLVGDVLDVGHVPGADDRAVRGPELHPPPARNQGEERVVVAGAGAVAAVVGGGAAVGDVDPPALGDEPAGEQDAGDGLAAAALADDQRQRRRELPVVGVEALDRAAGVRGPEDQTRPGSRTGWR